MNVVDLIEKFGGPSAFAEAIGRQESHVRTMKARKSIPSAYWQEVVEAAVARGFSEITYESLIQMHARPRAAHPVGAHQ